MAKSQGRQDIFGIVRRVLRWKSTLLDRAAEFFEDGQSESAAGTSNEHCAEFGPLQVEVGWLKNRGVCRSRSAAITDWAPSRISRGSVTKTSYGGFPSIARVSAHRWKKPRNRNPPISKGTGVPTPGGVRMRSSISRTVNGLGEPTFQPIDVSQPGTGTHKSKPVDAKASRVCEFCHHRRHRQGNTRGDNPASDTEMSTSLAKASPGARTESAGIRRVPIEERIRRIVERQSVGCNPAACDEQEGRGVGSELGIGHHQARWLQSNADFPSRLRRGSNW